MKIKKIIALFSVLFIACSALNLVEPSSAADVKKGYLIDHGTKYPKWMGDDFKVTYKTYWYSKNTQKSIINYYYKDFSTNQ